MKKILVTGGAGYIGSVLVRELLFKKKYRVKVIDFLRYGGESLLGLFEHQFFEFLKADIRNEKLMQKAFKDVWGVVHLAAIVGDPACAKEPKLAESINLDGSMRLYEIAENSGIDKFVFASTCSNYGKMEDSNSYVDENSPLRPVSLYAKTKFAFEKYLLSQPKSNNCKPTCLRFSTAYGISPRARFDLTVNEFTKELVLGRELTVYGKQFWRPYCHVVDLANSVITVLEAEEEKVSFDVFNVGSTEENYQKQMIIDLISQEIPNCKIKYVTKNEDPRDYKVNFAKIRDILGFKISRRMLNGIREIKYIIEQGFLLNPDDKKYSNILM